MAQQQEATGNAGPGTATPQGGAAPAPGTQAPPKVTDLSLVDEKVLGEHVQREADRRATEAATTAARKAKEKADRDELEKKGEYDKLKSQLEKRATDAEQMLQAKEAFFELSLEAVKAGIQDPSDIKLIAEDQVAACFKDGQLQRAAVTKAVDTLKAAKPYLFKSTFGGAPSPGSAAPAAPQGGEQPLTAEAVIKARQDRATRTKTLTPPDASQQLMELLRRGK